MLGRMELRRPSYFALATLIDGPLHGYAIVRRAAELSDGDVRLSTGTLYALLERAIDAGLVVAGDPYVEGGRRRRDYSLTQTGRDELQAEAQRLAAGGPHGQAPAAGECRGGDAMTRARLARIALGAYPAPRARRTARRCWRRCWTRAPARGGASSASSPISCASGSTCARPRLRARVPGA